MKNFFLGIAMLLAAGSTFAQVTVPEPEFIGSYNILTSDSTYASLPKESALIGSEETKKAGYVQFTGQKYGEKSYLLTIPASELEKGEYGVFYMSIVTATSIPVGTFSVK